MNICRRNMTHLRYACVDLKLHLILDILMKNTQNDQIKSIKYFVRRMHRYSLSLVVISANLDSKYEKYYKIINCYYKITISCSWAKS